jgi:hypothetical protein
MTETELPAELLPISRHNAPVIPRGPASSKDGNASTPEQVLIPSSSGCFVSSISAEGRVYSPTDMVFNVSALLPALDRLQGNRMALFRSARLAIERKDRSSLVVTV